MYQRLLPILWRPSANLFELDSSLPPDQVGQRIRAGVAKEAQVQGQVVGQGFRLERVGPTAQAPGTFAPICYGVMLPQGDGCRLHVHFQLNPVMRLFLAVWFGGSVLLALAFLIAAAMQDVAVRRGVDALPILLLALQPSLGLLLVRYQQARGRPDERWLQNWLTDLVDGR
jgi:hypothetical protein